VGQPARKAILVANPKCVMSRGQTLPGLHALLRGAGLETSPMVVEPDDPAAELVHRAEAVGADLVVAAGGDGTAHLVANAIAGTGLMMGVLPLGTANDFARTLALPLDLEAAARALAGLPPRPVDLGRVNGRYFLNAAHLGLGVETARRADARLKRWIGPLAYVLAAAGAWRAAEPLALALKADGQTAVMRASQVLVGNGRFFGGGNVVGPDATLEDGLLDVQLVAPELPARALPRLAGALRRGEMGAQPEAMAFRTARLEVSLRRAADANLDGEIVRLGDRLVFEVVPGAIAVVAPRPGRPAGQGMDAAAAASP
jgi:YegS/Rv2252/BmrU family lipid kinase